jgi:plasmid stabilization system protein ParE
VARVIVSPFAIADQDEILRYLAREAGILVAEKYDAAFRALLQRLRIFRESEPRVPRLARECASVSSAPML